LFGQILSMISQSAYSQPYFCAPLDMYHYGPRKCTLASAEPCSPTPQYQKQMCTAQKSRLLCKYAGIRWAADFQTDAEFHVSEKPWTNIKNSKLKVWHMRIWWWLGAMAPFPNRDAGSLPLLSWYPLKFFVLACLPKSCRAAGMSCNKARRACYDVSWGHRLKKTRKRQRDKAIDKILWTHLSKHIQVDTAPVILLGW
jgi:hypothetical protein